MSGQAAYHQRNFVRHTPRLVLDQHKAAVKAWTSLSADSWRVEAVPRTGDKFWNTSSGAMLNSIDTGSQVCSIVWSKHQRELCSSTAIPRTNSFCGSTHDQD
jgi:hypothetical protein